MRILVTGATSMIGDFLLPMLVSAGHEVVATSRKAHAPQQGVQWMVVDLTAPDWLDEIGAIDVWVHFAALGLLSPLLPEAVEKTGMKRLIAFSSTSKFTKADARGSHDRGVAESLARGESDIEHACRELGIRWSIFRPTLIYSLGRDKNLTLIVNKIRQFHLFPLVDGGKGLRQPVHAEDLATACVQAMATEKSENNAYNLSGAEVLSYREMVERLFAHTGISPRFIHVPLGLLRFCMRFLSLLPKYRHLTPDMADRMVKDMVFSHEAAEKDFGFSPRKFLP